MKSVIQDKKECYICTATKGLHDHHVFHGTANRKKSEKHGMKVWLCQHHHTGGKHAVHNSRITDLYLKKIAQRKFEETHSREEFMKEFGKNYL